MRAHECECGTVNAGCSSVLEREEVQRLALLLEVSQEMLARVCESTQNTKSKAGYDYLPSTRPNKEVMYMYSTCKLSRGGEGKAIFS